MDFEQTPVAVRCLKFLSNLDLSQAREQVLAELAFGCHAQSGALWLLDSRRMLILSAHRGLLDAEALPERLDAEGPLRLKLSTEKPWRAGQGRESVLCVPLHASGELVGLAQLSDPLSGDFGPEQVRSLKLLADFSAIALKNARRFSQLEEQQFKEDSTGVYTLPYFAHFCAKEIDRARRFHRVFSLLTFSLDNLSLIHQRLGAADAASALQATARTLARSIRGSDLMARLSEHEFCVLLSETDYFGALLFGRRAVAMVRAEPGIESLESRMPLALVAGAATYPKDASDFEKLVLLCRARMEQRRQSLQRRLFLDDLAFWEMVEVLLGNPSSAKLPEDPRQDAHYRGNVDEALWGEAQKEAVRELLRAPKVRGVLYVGSPEIRADFPLSVALEAAPADVAFRVYALGRRANLDPHKIITPIFVEGDDPLSRHEFLLWLSENSAYALLQRRGLGAAWGFQTSDVALVEALIVKLQACYDLQPF